MTLSRVMFRNIASNARKMARVPSTPSVQGFRGMSSIIDRKEMAEESRYIRSMEAKRDEELKQRMEKILAMEDSHETKQDLLELLEKKDEPQGFMAKYGLNDWRVAVPVSLLFVLPAIENGVIAVDVETQLTACFIIFASTLYFQVGPIISKALDDHIVEVEKDMKMVDDAALQQVHTAIDENKKALSLKEDYESLYKLTDDMAIVQAQVLNMAEEHKYREAVAKKLDSLYALEEAASHAIRTRMVTSVKTEVLKTFTQDKKAKENALQQAIAVLAAGQGAKIGKDVVGEVFSGALSNYRTAYAKVSPDADEILVQLQKDMQAVAQAPVVEAKGGNVFNTI